jgi:hypothetical protein
MTRKLLLLCGAALALLMVSSVLHPADARRGHRGHHFHNGHAHHHHHRFHRHGHLYGVPFVYGYYSYSDGCYWMRQRALYTGSPYWWNRYYACIHGDY